jgi:hypothetical protein
MTYINEKRKKTNDCIDILILLKGHWEMTGGYLHVRIMVKVIKRGQMNN